MQHYMLLVHLQWLLDQLVCQTAGALIAGGPPQNALNPSPRDTTQNIMAAKSKRSQMPLPSIKENTELEPPTSSASLDTEDTVVNLVNQPRVLPHHGYSLLKRVVDIIHCLGSCKMNMTQMRQDVANTRR